MCNDYYFGHLLPFFHLNGTTHTHTHTVIITVIIVVVLFLLLFIVFRLLFWHLALYCCAFFWSFSCHFLPTFVVILLVVVVVVGRFLVPSLFADFWSNRSDYFFTFSFVQPAAVLHHPFALSPSSDLSSLVFYGCFSSFLIPLSFVRLSLSNICNNNRNKT